MQPGPDKNAELEELTSRINNLNKQIADASNLTGQLYRGMIDKGIVKGRVGANALIEDQRKTYLDIIKIRDKINSNLKKSGYNPQVDIDAIKSLLELANQQFESVKTGIGRDAQVLGKFPLYVSLIKKYPNFTLSQPKTPVEKATSSGSRNPFKRFANWVSSFSSKTPRTPSDIDKKEEKGKERVVEKGTVADFKGSVKPVQPPIVIGPPSVSASTVPTTVNRPSPQHDVKYPSHEQLKPDKIEAFAKGWKDKLDAEFAKISVGEKDNAQRILDAIKAVVDLQEKAIKQGKEFSLTQGINNLIKEHREFFNKQPNIINLLNAIEMFQDPNASIQAAQSYGEGGVYAFMPPPFNSAQFRAEWIDELTSLKRDIDLEDIYKLGEDPILENKILVLDRILRILQKPEVVEQVTREDFVAKVTGELKKVSSDINDSDPIELREADKALIEKVIDQLQKGRAVKDAGQLPEPPQAKPPRL